MGHWGDQGNQGDWGNGAIGDARRPRAIVSLQQEQGALKYRQFRIQLKDDSFALEGWEREFPTLRELLDALKGCTLRSGHESFTVKRCCPPAPGEVSDLLIVRRVKDDAKRILNLSQLSFHQIRKNEITQASGPPDGFYFRNWHGLDEKEPAVCRGGARHGDARQEKPHGGALLDKSSFEYLFEQGKYDFINDVAPLRDAQGEQELQRFKNECLGMAVLHLSHVALTRGLSLEDVARKYSFKNCIPRSFRRQLQQNSYLTRFRLKSVFRRFVRRFQRHTVGAGRLTAQDVMYKYLATLEQLAPRFGAEVFPVLSLDTSSEGERAQLGANGGRSPPKEPLVTHELLVTGTSGIQWRPVPAESLEGFSQRGYFGRRSGSQEAETKAEQRNEAKWAHFCDFREITHVVVKDNRVSVHRQDNKCLELLLPSAPVALSLVSLLDGYFRLTADSSHYLCHEVAPPRLVMSILNGIHGPMQEEFALAKLRCAEAEDGLYVTRWSVLDFNRIILSVAKRSAQPVRGLVKPRPFSAGPGQVVWS
ncbi:non-receptor tyrosine-protein kinase TYK2 isoform B [Patagioenas fasciata monilis]|uniref:Non-receptor tyrosine-protein kinase TYK2 isoform B n=1 Tax=Patagioenas fasciata monilis TaxID=372326 RepID=A0A1V4KY01_PATFA|nr:non-receptor tyrosine-protein kinase TYK2 isoform B [Patagioenas fasciata monilis]